jgi:AraC-like DNA-binding protein
VERLNRLPNDAISAWLRAVKVHSTVYCLSDLRAPWGFRVENSAVAKFHFVLEGACVLTLASGEQIRVECGELILLPRGSGHTAQDRAGSRVRYLERILVDHPVDNRARLVYGGHGPLTRLLCGGFVLADAPPDGLLALLPEVLKLDAGTTGLSRWLEPIFTLLREEVGASRPGAAAVFAKIADVFLAQALRGYLVGADAASLVALAPLQDPAIARAAKLLHERPQQPWTVGALAREVGMSRTLFATRFRALVGETPMRHLTRVRLSRAAGHLTTTNDTMYAIADRAGYESEASFSKAFKRAFGRSPSEYRRQHLTSPIVIGERPNGVPLQARAVPTARPGPN